MDTLRSQFAALMGGLIMLLFSFGACTVGASWKLARYLHLVYGDNPASLALYWWSKAEYHLVYRMILRQQVHIHPQSRLDQSQIMVCEATHFTLIGMIIQLYVISHYVCPRVRICMRPGVMNGIWGVLAGWPMWCMDCAIILDRDNPKQAREALASCVLASGKPYAYVIYPDSRRPTRKRIDEDRERFDAPFLQHTLFPRKGGAWTLLQAAIGQASQVTRVEVATGYVPQDYEIWDLDRLAGATYHARVQQLDGTPASEDVHGAELRERWRDINAWLSQLRN